MKKVLIGILALIMVLGLVGCSSESKDDTSNIEGTWICSGKEFCDNGVIEEESYPTSDLDGGFYFSSDGKAMGYFENWESDPHQIIIGKYQDKGDFVLVDIESSAETWFFDNNTAYRIMACTNSQSESVSEPELKSLDDVRNFDYYYFYIYERMDSGNLFSSSK